MLKNKDIELLVEKHGWQSIFVSGTEGTDCFIYSIGFEESYQHPEIIFFDYGVENSHSLMSHIANLIQDGKSFTDKGTYLKILTKPYQAMFVVLNDAVISEYLLLANKYYNKPFDAMLMILSDEQGVFPHENGYKLKDQQTVVTILGSM